MVWIDYTLSSTSLTTIWTKFNVGVWFLSLLFSLPTRTIFSDPSGRWTVNFPPFMPLSLFQIKNNQQIDAIEKMLQPSPHPSNTYWHTSQLNEHIATSYHGLNVLINQLSGSVTAAINSKLKKKRKIYKQSILSNIIDRLPINENLIVQLLMYLHAIYSISLNYRSIGTSFTKSAWEKLSFTTL